MNLHTFRQEVEKTYKSFDTEERIDMYFTRPIGYLWTLLFARLGVHPNVVTILSIVLGLFSGFCFYHRELWWNVVGILVLMLSNFYDSADGQLARMTGKTTVWGRILDGFSSDLTFIAIYFGLLFRLWDQDIPFTHMHWGVIILLLLVLSGVFFHKRHCQLSDYYRNIHLFLLRGDNGSELTTSERQYHTVADLTIIPRRGNLWYRQFMWAYWNYTCSQERLSPAFQRLRHALDAHQDGRFTEAQRQYFLQHSRPLMKFTNILTFNWRAITLAVACLMDMPWLYLLVEFVIFESIFQYMRYRHNEICRSLEADCRPLPS